MTGQKKPRRKLSISSESMWIREMNLHLLNPEISNYDSGRTFKTNELIEHPQFGVGVVRKITGGAMMVLFRQGEKKLQHQVSA